MATLLALGACSTRINPIAAYRHLDDKIKALSGGLFGYPCTREVREADGTKYLEGTDTADCYRFAEPRRMHGIWIDNFENSAFIEGAADVSAALRYSGPQTWLQETVWSTQSQSRIGRIYRIDFIGRRAEVLGYYGHFGGSDSLVLADRILSLQRLPSSSESY